jgi:hypothetical protein
MGVVNPLGGLIERRDAGVRDGSDGHGEHDGQHVAETDFAAHGLGENAEDVQRLFKNVTIVESGHEKKQS